MLVLLSPAKSINTDAEHTIVSSSTPGFVTDTAELLQTLQSYSKAVLQQTLGVSPALASLNYARYQSWCQQASKPAGYAFDGPAYKALDFGSLQDADVQFAQQHVRILDALYGLIKPLDSIKPYRLEMSSKLPTQRGRTLYAFWGTRLVDTLNRELTDCAPDSQFLVNCASQEYFKAAQAESLCCPVYTMSFPGPAVHAKAARGAMVRFIVQQKVQRPEELKSFTGLNNEWTYCAQRSTEQQFTFIRSAVHGSKQKRSDSAEASGNERQTKANQLEMRKAEASADCGAGKPSSKKQRR
ncbi:hypothetical protein ABBQ32_013588 [Trebouxia sp. C0010 RCD-2024]